MIKTAIFVDVQNIYYTTRQIYGRQFNYRAFWQQLSQGHDIQLANAYAIQRSDDQQHKFQTALKHIGFNVKLKPFIQRADGSAKGDWDVGITIDIMEAAAELGVDKVILLSGDGDFDLLMHHIRDKHQVTTQVFGVEQLTANTLVNAVDSFTAIDDNLLL
ncbi:NYN domain-containing protein [Thalassotalea euphylliae]|uniref:NYN domain-containing protein n=1 Tax=Thalassotalea euphylliae TaxID=1655234 RepID=A0A3E0U5F7_9GAMM|nr:NYN domain-containing protein [Thalassotalea euphylliae]REL31192.1 NYN domain-containing protein [Thalassotalea euphylliae]